MGGNLNTLILLQFCLFLIFFLKQIEIFVNMGPYGSETFKRLLLLQFWFFFLHVPCDSPHKNLLTEIIKFKFHKLIEI